MVRFKKNVSWVEVSYKENSLILSIYGDIKFRILNQIIEKLTQESNRHNEMKYMENFVLDLSNISYITSSAALGLICLSAAIMNKKIDKIATPLNLYLKRSKERVLNYLIYLGFFQEMVNKAGLLECEDLIILEDKRKKRRTYMSKDSLDDLKPIILPMKTIPVKGGTRFVGSEDFQNTCQNFMNDIKYSFEELFSSSHYNFDKKDLYEFRETNGELFVNIFQHSASWGLALIHAKPIEGTMISYHDIGIGIKESFNSSPKVGGEFQKFETDLEAMLFALVEGNSSKIGGNGRGLTVLEEFVLNRNGTIEIKSGNHSLIKKPGDKFGVQYWRAKKVPEFPGTQINYFIPSN